MGVVEEGCMSPLLYIIHQFHESRILFRQNALFSNMDDNPLTQTMATPSRLIMVDNLTPNPSPFQGEGPARMINNA